MLTLTQALDIFCSVDRSPLTNKQYRATLTRVFAALNLNTALNHVRYEDLLAYLQQRSDLQHSTLRVYVGVLKTFFAWCVQHDYLEKSPATGLRWKARSANPYRNRAIPAHELQAMVDYCRDNDQHRNLALLLFMIDTGCRVGGLLSLTLENLDLHLGQAVILEKGGHWLKVYYSDETASTLQTWLDHRPKTLDTHVWIGAHYKVISRVAVANIIADLSKKTGASQKWHPHAIRHSVGHAYAEKFPVTVTQRKLGHSDPATTMRYYYPQDENYVADVSRRHPLLALRRKKE